MNSPSRLPHVSVWCVPLLAVVLVAARGDAGTTIRVPADYATIPGAIGGRSHMLPLQLTVH